MKKTNKTIKVTILGCGSFFIDKDHSAPAYLLESKGKKVLLDCGPGTQNQLAKIGVSPEELDAIFISHFHNDHTSDLFSILFRPYLLDNYYGGKYNKTLSVYGPKGIKKFVYTIAEIFKHKAFKNYKKIKFVEVKKSMIFGKISIKSFKVTHLGLDCHAYRFEVDGKVVSYTGDAAMSPGVAQAAQDADIFITDCSTPKKYPAIAHLSTAQVGEICKKSNVKKVILSHQVPPGYKIDMVSEVREVFEGKVVLAKDLMKIEI